MGCGGGVGEPDVSRAEQWSSPTISGYLVLLGLGRLVFLSGRTFVFGPFVSGHDVSSSRVGVEV